MLGVEGRTLSYGELVELAKIASRERTRELSELLNAIQSLEKFTKVSNIVFGGRDRDVLDILDDKGGRLITAIAKIWGGLNLAFYILALPGIGVSGLLALAIYDGIMIFGSAAILKGIIALVSRTNILRKAIALGAKGIAWIAEKVSGMFGAGSRTASQRPSVHLQMAYVLLS